MQKQLSAARHVSTTAIYEFVSDDYRRTMLRTALNTTTIHDAVAQQQMKRDVDYK